MAPLLEKNIPLYSINSNDPDAPSIFYRHFDLCLSKIIPRNIETVILLCIGTDRSTGDCLGPLIGHRLQNNKYNNIHIVGTLENPVHAKNLEETIQRIKVEHPHPFIIALDACLGKQNSVGSIHIAPGPLTPGAGVNKVLPSVGDMHIKGIVNLGGFMEYIILQNTRLHMVMKMADIISTGLNEHFTLMSSSYYLNSTTGRSYLDYY